MITVYMNVTRTKYKCTNTTSSVPYFTYEPPRRFISKINNLRFASTGLCQYRALSLLRALYWQNAGCLSESTVVLSI